MKAKKIAFALVCGLALSVFVSAQTKRAISVNSKIETVLKVVSDSEEGLELSNRLAGIDQAAAFSVQQGAYTSASTAGVPRAFTTLSVKDYAYTNKVGYPMLPVRVELMEIPQGATPRVVYGKIAYKDIDLAKAGYPQPIYPVQTPVSKSAKTSPDFAYNAEAYRADGFFADGSSELVEVKVLGEMRATRIAKVLARPVQYNAATHTLRVYTTLDFEIVYDHADWNATYAKKARYASPAFGLLRNEVVNPVNAKAVVSQSPMRYVIVADPMFKDSLQKFVNWKTRFGYEVVQAYTDQPEVGNTAESIHDYLKGLYENATEDDPAPSYVLLVGDLEQIPTKTYKEGVLDNRGALGKGEKHYSDLYLCEYTGDHFPEVHYGRMSATSVDELMPQINKTMYMESLVPEKSSFLDTCVAVAGSDNGRYDFTHLIPTVNYICEYYMRDTLQRHTYKYLYPESSQKAEAILQHFSDGAAIVLYTAHGEETGWYDPKIGVNDVNTKLRNKDKYPLSIGNCCLTGRFDYSKTCYGEALLRKKDAGAVVYIGASDVTYFNQDVYWAIGYTSRFASGYVQTYEKTELGAFDALNHTHGEPYENWAITAHEIVYAGNMAVQRANQDLEDYYWEVYHVFGDPSYMPYTRNVSYPQLTYEPTLVVGDNLFNVKTVPYARVAMSKGSKLLGFAMADKNGDAYLEVKGLDSAGMVNLTVAAQNYLPLHKEISVSVHPGKYLTVDKQEITDISGKAVQKGLYGEAYNVRYTLRNVGQVAVDKIVAKVRSLDEFLTVEDSSCTVSATVRPGERYVLEHSFVLKVNHNVPDKHTLKFAVDLTMNDETDSTLTRESRFLVEAPDIAVVSFVIDDTDGIKPNGVIDNGETVKATVTLVNLGSVVAEGVKMRVSSQAKYLNLPDSIFEIGMLESQENKTLTFEYSAKEGNVHYSLYTLDFEFETKGRKSTDHVQSYIDPVVETFESGDFKFVDWNQESDWIIDQNKVHQGEFSAVSSPIADKNKSTLSIKVDVTIDDVVGFYFFTSSEMVNNALGDFLRFYIDDTCKGFWGGEDTDWRYVEFPVPAGEHTLSWIYEKDASESKGEDRVWIDDVRLPIGSHAPEVANEKKTSVESFARMQVIGAVSDRLEVRFDAREPLAGSLYVVNVMGQRVKTLASGLHVDAGTESLSFPVTGLASGVYVLVFETASGSRSAVKFVKTV